MTAVMPTGVETARDLVGPALAAAVARLTPDVRKVAAYHLGLAGPEGAPPGTLAGADGRYVVRRCPPAWKKEVRVWGRESGDRALMRHVKATLDPKNLFNPGRFV